MAGENAALKAEAELKKKVVDPVAGLFRRDHAASGVNKVADAGAGQIDVLMPDGVTPRKKIALIGFATSSRDSAPFDEIDWAIVGMNQLSRHIPRGDVWFEIHKEWNVAVVPGTDHAAWLRDCGIPVFMTDVVPGLPTSTRYPIERLIAKFGLDYFTSTVAYMVAWAVDHIDQMVEARLKATPGNNVASAFDVVQLQRSLYAEHTIGIFGIDLIVGEEYDWQRACAEFWIGQALARNITVVIPPQSALLRQRFRYGYDIESPGLLRESDLEKRHAFLTGEHQKLSELLVQALGALKENEFYKELARLRSRGGTLE